MVPVSEDIMFAYQNFDYKQVIKIAEYKINILEKRMKDKYSKTDKFYYLEMVLYYIDALRLTEDLDKAEKKCTDIYKNMSKNEDDTKIIDAYIERFNVLHAQILLDKSLFSTAFFNLKEYLQNKFGEDYLTFSEDKTIQSLKHWDLKALNLYGLTALQLKDLSLVEKVHQTTAFLLGYFKPALLLEDDCRNIYKDFYLDSLYLYALWLHKIKDYSHMYDNINKFRSLLDAQCIHLNMEQTTCMNYIEGISTKFLSKKEKFLKEAAKMYTSSVLENQRRNTMLLNYLKFYYENRLELGSVGESLLKSFEEDLAAYSSNPMYTDQDYINKIYIVRPFFMI